MTSVRHNRAGSETRAAILDCAVGVILDHGIGGLTLQEVARRADIKYGNLTHHYPSRDQLMTAVLDSLEARYLEEFGAFALSIADAPGSPVEYLLGWLLDDAVTRETAGIFLELWASATRDPQVADRVNRLYDQAVDACIRALGACPSADTAQPLREALYLLGTVVEGSSALFSARTGDAALYRAFRRDALLLVKPLIEQRLAEARAGPA